MITLDIDLSYLAKYFEINTQRLGQYSGKSIEEVIEAEATQNGKKSSEININEFVNSPGKLVKLLKLMDATNRFLIIRNLNDDDLNALLENLESEDLVWGLQYFSVDKLVDLLKELPQEELLKLVLDKFGIENIIALMETDEMNHFLTSEKIDREDVTKFFEQLNEEQFKKMMVQIMGPEVLQKDRKDVMMQFENLNDRDYKRAMQSFDKKSKMFITYGLIYNKPDYIKELSNEALVRPFEYLEKEKILESMKELDPKFLIPMVQELPKDLIQVVATQIDPAVFADFLSENFSDILSEIAI